MIVRKQAVFLQFFPAQFAVRFTDIYHFIAPAHGDQANQSLVAGYQYVVIIDHGGIYYVKFS